MPPFQRLVKYAEEYRYSWHTPGHMGGLAFLRHPAGIACHKFFGENLFRSDLSVSVADLGSLLDHNGVVGDSEREAARVFGADETFFVTNGNSAANQIVWRARVGMGDIALLDRNCHKSLNYAHDSHRRGSHLHEALKEPLRHHRPGEHEGNGAGGAEEEDRRIPSYQ